MNKSTCVTSQDMSNSTKNGLCTGTTLRDNSVFQFFILGKGKFTLVLKEEDDEKSIQFGAEEKPEDGT
ncbi:hypothetical protein [Aquibacillus sediminis]|uniref:hypothetical protein n=1 Tax=Aquibacillus sediminis TaxID=2574734 RepID=UPI001107BFA9|nr:hypothetical protein [Aquibacillus sediminis]